MRIPPDWIQWVATNLALGERPEALVEILVSAGFNKDDAEMEIAAARGHPYIAAAADLAMQLKKREWLLLTLNEKFKSKDKYSLKPLPLPPFKDFLRDYYYENRPGVFTGAAEHWSATQWTPERLKRVIGSELVEVQSGRTRDEKYEENRDSFRKTMPFDQFIDQVLTLQHSNDLYMTANNIGGSQATMRKIFPDIGNLGDGYLNLNNMDDKCFVWIGPGGTLTPLHHDLTNNFFVQLYGRKRFLMVPACEVPYVFNEKHVYTKVDIFNPDYQRYPLFKRATVLEVTLNPGDSLFIPIGWWHAVESLDVSISVSMTNFNAPNAYNSTYPGFHTVY